MGNEKDEDSAVNSQQPGPHSPFISYDAICGPLK